MDEQLYNTQHCVKMEDVYVSGIDQKLPINYEKIKYFHNASNQEYPIVIVNSMDTITNCENALRLEINAVSDHPTLMFTIKPGECMKILTVSSTNLTKNKKK
jgi:hypothetical protein